MGRDNDLGQRQGRGQGCRDREIGQRQGLGGRDRDGDRGAESERVNRDRDLVQIQGGGHGGRDMEEGQRQGHKGQRQERRAETRKWGAKTVAWTWTNWIGTESGRARYMNMEGEDRAIGGRNRDMRGRDKDQGQGGQRIVPLLLLFSSSVLPVNSLL